VSLQSHGPRGPAALAKEENVRFAAVILFMLAPAAAVAIELNDLFPTCLSCHGEKGTSALAEVPSLGAQTEPYTQIQLYLFREKLRANETMNAITHDFKDEDLQTFAHAISLLPAPAKVTQPPDAAAMARGSQLVEKYRCNFCHNAGLEGRDNIPRIASQREDFLIRTLLEYKANIRYGYDASMADVLAPVSEREIRDLAYYIARQ
jgi:cytochrome c553